MTDRHRVSEIAFDRPGYRVGVMACTCGESFRGELDTLFSAHLRAIGQTHPGQSVRLGRVRIHPS